MTVNVEKGVFFCHACDAKGGAVQLVQLMEGCDRADAERRAEKIAADAGHEIKRPAGRYRRPGGNPDGERPWKPLGSGRQPYRRPA